jgi:hypothetical protein
VVQTSPGLGNGRGVGKLTHGPLNLCQVTSSNHGWGLAVDANLEAGGTPLYELDRPLSLHDCDGRVNILGHDIAAVQHAACHVLPASWVAFNHLNQMLK